MAFGLAVRPWFVVRDLLQAPADPALRVALAALHRSPEPRDGFESVLAARRAALP
ncbi:MAG: hypothetical protein IT382_16860, partial [Deltaproteobacteria bacterium]|nr:hypothetical protein [Deltaproteobacteria bacterium]